MIRCIVIEDQMPARKILQKYIANVAHLELVDMFPNALDALDYLRKHSVDLLFLDIHLPRLSGTDFLAVLENQPYVILTTAFSDYALQGYELDVVDYLLKPFSFERFQKSVMKVERLMEKAPSTMGNRAPDSVLVKVGYDIVKIKLSEISYIQADGDYTIIFCVEKKFHTSYPLKYWTESLPESQFLQVHRSYLINILEVTKTSSTSLLVNNKTIPLGRVFKKKFHAVYLKSQNHTHKI